MAKSKNTSAEAQACDINLTKMQKARENYHSIRDKFFEGKATEAQLNNALDIYNERKEVYHDSLRDLARKVVKEHKDSVVNNSKSAKPAAPVKSKTSRTCKPVQTSPKTAKPAAPKPAANTSDKKSYTVKQGREVKTFSTKAEAKAYAGQCKNKNVTITEGTKKPTHRLVKFTARK